MQPWDRAPDESPQSHAALLSYLHAGAGRSLARVRQSTGKNLRLLERWSAKHAWVQRAAEWDAFLADKAAEAAISEVEQMARRHAGLGDLLVAVAHQRIAELVNSQDLAKIPIGQLPRWAHVGVLIGRMSRGAASEIIGGEGAAAQAASQTLGDFFVIKDDVSELDVARMVAERVQRGEADGDLELELADLLEEGDDPGEAGEDLGPDQEEDLEPVQDRTPEPGPEAEAQVPAPPEPAAVQDRPAEPPPEPPRLVAEDGRLVKRPPPPSGPPPPKHVAHLRNGHHRR